MIPGSFDYFTPRSIPEAIELLSAHRDDVKVLSGGQSLLPLMKMRLSKPGYIVDIGKIPGLDGIVDEGNTLVLGALVTHAQMALSVAALPMRIRRATCLRRSWRWMPKSKWSDPVASVGLRRMIFFWDF